MKKYRFLLAFSIALPTALVLAVFARSRVGPEEQPPCRACSQKTGELPLASVCDLVQNPQKYAEIPVRVDRRFRHDSGEVYVEDGGCSMHAGFASQWQACRGAWRKLQVSCGVGSWYDGSASVRATGSISMIPAGNYFQGEKGFTLVCLEEVREKLTFRHRMNFALKGLL